MSRKVAQPKQLSGDEAYLLRCLKTAAGKLLKNAYEIKTGSTEERFKDNKFVEGQVAQCDYIIHVLGVIPGVDEFK